MSFSPVRRLSCAGAANSRENLINAYEAEEERIINVLSRKLEQLKEEKIDLENALEAESESHVNRMARELTALRFVQSQQQNGDQTSISSQDTGAACAHVHNSVDPSVDALLEAMRLENEQLRHRLVETERDYIRISRLNELYRQELIEHRSRLGLSVDSLIGLSPTDPYSQPTHRRSTSSSYSTASSPGTSVIHVRPTNGVPIPRPSSRIRRTGNLGSSGNTPHSHSPSSSDSPFPFSPMTTTGSLASPSTNMTSPPSPYSFNISSLSASLGSPRTLSYPSVPPPSLSSSFGSPTVSYVLNSPVESLSRRDSGTRRSTDWRVHSHQSGEGSRRSSIERGARVAETGTLLPRSRAGSQNLPPMTETLNTSEAGENGLPSRGESAGTVNGSLSR